MEETTSVLEQESFGRPAVGGCLEQLIRQRPRDTPDVTGLVVLVTTVDARIGLDRARRVRAHAARRHARIVVVVVGATDETVAPRALAALSDYPPILFARDRLRAPSSEFIGIVGGITSRDASYQSRGQER